MNHEKFQLQWNLDLRAKGLTKFVRYEEVSLYRGSFSYFTVIGVKKSFVIPRTSLYRDSSYRGSNVALKNKTTTKV